MVFLEDHHRLDVIGIKGGLKVNRIKIISWVLKFYDSSTKTLVGAGILIKSPIGIKIALPFNLDFECVNS